MTELERAFYHELGHYVAEKINQSLNYSTGVKEIRLYPCTKNLNKYCGCLVTNNPVPNNKFNMYEIASLIHGCIFESYFLNHNSLEECFNCHGYDDLKKWNQIISNKFIGRNSDFASADNDFYSDLYQKRLLEIFRLDFKKYLLPLFDSAISKYTIDLVGLDNVINIKLRCYIPYYCELINKYNNINRL